MVAGCLQGSVRTKISRTCSGSPSHGVRLAGLDGKRVAVVVNLGDRDCVFKGVARYRQFPFANDLRIDVKDETSKGPDVIAFTLLEGQWDGEIVRDDKYGCDFQARIQLRA